MGAVLVVVLMSEQSVLTAPVIPIPEIIYRYVQGESMQTLARECRVHRGTIYNWIFSGVADQQHEQLVTQAMINRIADADQEMDDSADALSITRAREHMRFTRMDFERRRPKLYGPKQELGIDNRITVIVQRERPQPVVVGGNQAIDAVVSAQDVMKDSD